LSSFRARKVERWKARVCSIKVVHTVSF
jgi:hypothetical protein